MGEATDIYGLTDICPAKAEDGLPPGWAATCLGEFCLVIQGQSPPGESYNKAGEGLPFFQGKAQFGDLYPEADTWCTEPKKTAEPDDVLISIRAPVGPTNICPSKACIGRGLAAVRPLAGVPSKYVLYYMRQTKDALVANSTGSTFDAISGDALRAHHMLVAPLPEQRRIVAEIEKQFTRLESAVAALKRAQAHLKRYRASVLKAASEGRLVPTEADLARAENRPYEPADQLLARILEERRAKWETDQLAKMQAAARPGRAGGKPPKDDKWKAKYKEPALPDTSNLPLLPEGWTWATLSALAELQGGITKGQKRRPGDALRAVSYLRVANVQRGFLDLEEVKLIGATEPEIAELRLVRGDILFTEGGDRDKLGRGAVWRGELDECIHQNHIFRARLFSPELNPHFISSYGNSLGQQYFVGEGKQTTNLASINLTKLAAFPLPLPPSDEQPRIVAEVERRLSVIDELEATVDANLKRAERLRQSILKRTFEGKLVPQDPNDEPASVLLERIRAEREKSVVHSDGRSGAAALKGRSRQRKLW
jgi:type I restriction enzyme S subunit